MDKSNIYQEDAVPSILKQVVKSYTDRGIYMVAFWFLFFMSLITLFGPILAPYDPHFQQTDLLLTPPSWADAGRVDYFFGTDDLGRDLLSRVMAGSRYTIGGALLTVLISGVIGVAIGAIAAMLRGIRSSILHHLLDTILAIPSLLLAILVIAVLGRGWDTILLAVTIGLIPQFIRVSHQASLQVLGQEYVRMARLDGYSGVQLFQKIVLPNMAEALITRFTAALSSAILDIAALGFLSLGAQSPAPEWGTMMANGIELLTRAPWVIALPGAAIFLTVLSINVAGEGLKNSFKQLRVS
ncbi:ABC transporter permease subunit [Echinimonas agarilytica]|uniref:ABC transporter permease subunit n=1 Tax=Echinimonas agarilytica TaxID=1215918 RepID=A0AA42B7H5_9GAMM|nr:ABC transporter permease subunit [Echinimonas agarilytica]MCM2680035.1 ABC transporter permease subunit [Echinimonas agarilytica]